MNFFKACVFALIAAVSCSISAAESLSDRIKSLEPLIGGYPPNIRSDEEEASVKKRYAALKAELDALITARPKDEDLLFMRASLQKMGHNFDYPGAWQGADEDFRQILNNNPKHVRAIVELGNLWVNSNPALAPKAESAFRAAQCIHGDAPLENAQQGLFFALYYQGRMSDAFRQSEFLVKTWPQSKKYRGLNEMVRSVLSRNGKVPEAEQKLVMASCE